MKKVPILAAALSLTWLLSASPASATGRHEAVPTAASDAVNATSVKARLMDKLGFDALLIAVSVAGGTATLTGEVAKLPSQGLAERVALSVKGIKKVDNKVTLGSEGEHCFATANSISTLR